MVNTFSSVQFAILASKPLPLFQLQFLKAKNCVQEHAKLVTQIKKDYGSLCKASIVMNVHWTIFNRLCKPPQKKSKQLKEQWVDIKTSYARDNVSQELPLARAKGQRYMTKTLEEAYHMYTEHFAKSGKKCVSFSTFCKMRPRNIYKIGQTPDCQCICDTCENFRLLHQSIKNYLIKSIEHHTDTCIKQSLCPVLESESNTQSNSDGLNQVDPTYGYFNCITRNCKQCGSEVLMQILEENPDLQTSTEMVSLNRWEWVEKKGSKYKCLDIVNHPGTKKELVDQYIADLNAMSFRLFSCNRNYSQFMHICDNLKPGQLLPSS